MRGCLTGGNNSGGRAQGMSIDQAVANGISAGTRLKSIEASVYLKRNFIYSLFHSGPGQAIFPEDEPAKVFERLFSTGVPAPVTPSNPSPTVNEDFARLRARKKSILDRAMEEYRRLHATVGASDQMRLDRHMDGIREIERGLEALVGRAAARRGQRQLQDAGDAGAATDFQAHTKLHSRAADHGAGLRHHPGGLAADPGLADLVHLAGHQQRPARHLAPAGQRRAGRAAEQDRHLVHRAVGGDC